MLLVWKSLARLALASVVIAAPASAQAADIYDAWINVFEPKTFVITSVVTETKYDGGDQLEIQTIKGTSAGRTLQLRLQRFAGSSGFLAAFDPSGLDNNSRNAAALIRAFKLKEAEASNFQTLSSRHGRGATIDYQGCRVVMFGYRGTGENNTFEILVDGFDCGNKDAVTTYFEKTVQRSSRATNMAAASASEGRPAPAAPAKPALQVNCEAAKGDSGKLAAFMHSLSQPQLAQFLARAQDCGAFAGS